MARPCYLLDTNICIYIRRERPKLVLDRFKVLPPGSTAISLVTYGELVYGVRKSADPHKAMMILEESTALILVLPMAPDVDNAYGTIRLDLAARGAGIGNHDLWIAVYAKSLDHILVTNNESEFGRVDSLTVENWTRGSTRSYRRLRSRQPPITPAGCPQQHAPHQRERFGKVRTLFNAP